MKTRKYTKASVWSAGILAVIFGAVTLTGPEAREPQPPQYRNDQPPSVIDPELDVCRYFTEGEPMVSFSVEMRQEETVIPMRVPARYLMRSPTGEGEVLFAQLFSSIEIPSFEPLPHGELSARNLARLPWNWMSFLTHDVIPLAEIAGLRLRRNDLEFGDPRLSAEMENPPHPRDFPSEDALHDLIRVLPGENRQSFPPIDLFVSYRPDGELYAFLSCSIDTEQRRLNESCHHHFRWVGLDVSASYLRTELSNWQIIQDNIERFLSCATREADALETNE